MKRAIFLIVVLSTLVIAQSEKWQGQIDQINKAMIEAVMNGTPEVTIQYYVKDGISLPSYMPMMIGTDEMLKSAQEQKADEVNWLSFELKTKFVWESGDFVVEIGNYEYEMEIQMMSEPFYDSGKYLTIYEIQEDGTLKIKAETWNTDLNPWAMMAPPPPPEGEIPPPPPPNEE